jgi:two-component system, OmpR family, response regulator ResD
VAATVLVVEDERKLRELVRSYLERAGFTVLSTGSGAEALTLAGSAAPDLVILDLGLPDVAGETVARELRAAGGPPILMLTAKVTEEDRIAGLQLGADDYVTKPFSPRELALRVQAVLRRGAAPGAGTAATSPPLRSGCIEVDVAARLAWRAGRELTLTVREFDLLAFFMSHPGQAFTRAELMKRVWGWSFGDQSTVTVHVRRLRDKLEEDPASPLLLRTVRGIGYCWDGGPPTAVISNP